MRRRVAILAAVILAAILGWTAWWFVLATARDNALTVWLEDRRAAGWVAESSDVRVGGYPARVNSHITGLSLSDPRAGWSWQAQGLDILQLAYKPHHVIAVLEGEQVVATPYDTFRATGDTLRGSVLFRPNPRLELDHMTFEIADMAITSDAGWTASIGKAVLATRQAEAASPSPTTSPSTPRTSRSPSSRRPPRASCPPRSERSRSTRPCGSTAPGTGRASRATTRCSRASTSATSRSTWGRLDIRGRGSLAVDAEGFAEGRIDLRARNWEDMLAVAESSGALNPTLAGALRGGLALLARLSGDRDALDVPLEFEGGVARLGPIPIGAAPRLARR